MSTPPGSEPSRFPPPPKFRDEAPPPSVRPPREIMIAFWGFIVAAVVTLVGGLLVLGNRQAIVDALRTAEQQGTKLSDADINTAATALMVVSVAIAVVVAGLYVLFSFKVKAGRNWARIVLTIVVVLAVLSLLVDRGGSWLSYLGQAAGVIGVVFSFFPQSSAYIAEVKASRFRG